MSGFFALDWLRQREPFDHAARDRGCIARLVCALRLRDQRPLRLLDLASGSGAGMRALAPAIGADQFWTLTDHDPALLSAQARELTQWAAGHEWSSTHDDDGVAIDTGTSQWRALGHTIDLQQRLDDLDFTAFDAVTTSAFLDLVSRPWLERLATNLAASRRPLLAMLTVDGRRHWAPGLPDDGDMLRAFEMHQRRDKGFGSALGPEAASVLAGLLSARGYDITLARSDWRIGTKAAPMLERLIEDTLLAACEAHPDDTARFTAWAAMRRRHLAHGALSIEIGHLDLLALPDEMRSSSS